MTHRFAYVARAGPRAVGYIAADVHRYSASSRHLAHNMVFIHQISVRPGTRRQGSGRVLLDAVKSHGEALGTELLALDTWVFNRQALAFSEAYGFVPHRINLWNRKDGH